MPNQSRLLSEHQNESKSVKNHLHLLALEKAVYLELGLTAELKEIIDIDGKLPNGAYKKAWAIVNQTDSEYLKYVGEIRGDSSNIAVKSGAPFTAVLGTGEPAAQEYQGAEAKSSKERSNDIQG